ncbi:B12-binding domain-containing protein [Planctomycetota bacterium]
MDIKHNPKFSPKQLARAIGVSEASIKRWCDKGILVFHKTAGGHRRLNLHTILDFLKENEYELVQPDVLGLPAAVGTGPRTLAQASKLYIQALENGDEEQCMRLALDLRLAGHSMAVIGDHLIAPAFHALGEQWQHGELEVYQERRGVEMTRRVLLRLRDTQASPDTLAPVAIGVTLKGDPYTLPAQLGELVFSELGWRARFFGNDLPAETVAQAVRDLKPRVLWLSVSHVEDQDRIVAECNRLYETCCEVQCALAVGGHALTESLRQRIRYASFGDTLQHLHAFALSLFRVT